MNSPETIPLLIFAVVLIFVVLLGFQFDEMDNNNKELFK